jgi:hypothetical protein
MYARQLRDLGWSYPVETCVIEYSDASELCSSEPLAVSSVFFLLTSSSVFVMSRM